MLRAQHDVDVADAEVTTLQKSVDYWKEVRTSLGGEIKPIGKGTFVIYMTNLKEKQKKLFNSYLERKRGKQLEHCIIKILEIFTSFGEMSKQVYKRY